MIVSLVSLDSLLVLKINHFHVIDLNLQKAPVYNSFKNDQETDNLGGMAKHHRRGFCSRKKTVFAVLRSIDANTIGQLHRNQASGPTESATLEQEVLVALLSQNV